MARAGIRRRVRHQRGRRRREDAGRSRSSPARRREGRGRRRRPGRSRCPRAAVAAGSTIGVLIDVDEGMHRCGVASAEEALPLARRIATPRASASSGLTGYEGHCSLEFDAAKRHAMAREAMALLTGIAADLGASRAALPDRVGRRDRHLGGHLALPGGDGDPARLVRDDGRPPSRAWIRASAGRSPVLATVISRRADRIVLDAGSKTVGASHGVLKDWDLEPYRFDEEHSIFHADASCPLDGRRHGRDPVQLHARSRSATSRRTTSSRTTTWSTSGRSCRAGPESRWLLDMLERGD